MWEDNPREVVTCLCRRVLDGSVVILRAEPAYIAHSGFVPTRQYDDTAYEKDIAERASSYAARSKAHRDDLLAYNQAIDERDARTFFRSSNQDTWVRSNVTISMSRSRVRLLATCITISCSDGTRRAKRAIGSMGA
jgi:hypothetical protein